jgi:exodeoxyribonuclease III
MSDALLTMNDKNATLSIATWNVNSIRARQERVLAWLVTHQPDVLCLQETKVTDDTFPVDALRDIGYQAAIHGQKTYNGVALISKEPVVDVVRGFDDGRDDEQARFIGGSIAGVRVFSAYIPNGGSVASEKYQYKLEWLARLRAFLDRNEEAGAAVVLCGDWNVAPDDRDVHDPNLWEGELLCTEPERKALQRIVDWGLRDTFRLHCEEAGKFSWWDYRMLGFPKNRGLRIDHIYATESLALRCRSSEIHRDERKGKGASDHAPVVAVFEY